MKSSIYIRVTVLLIICILWEIIAKFTDPIIFPSIVIVGEKLWEILFQSETYMMIYHTLWKTVIGVLLSIFLGLIIGVIASINNKFYIAVKPLIVILQSVPVISWLLLSLIWLDNTYIPIFVVIISTISIVIINIHEGIKNVDKKMLEMCKVYEVDFKDMIKDIYMPSIVLNLTASAKIIIGLCFKISVMSEVVASVRQGIGEKLNWAWINIDTATVMAWTIMIIILTFLFEFLISKIIDRKVAKYV